MTENQIREKLSIPQAFQFTAELQFFYTHLLNSGYRRSKKRVRVWINGSIVIMPIGELMVFVDRGRKKFIGVYDNSKIEDLDADFVVIHHTK